MDRSTYRLTPQVGLAERIDLARRIGFELAVRLFATLAITLPLIPGMTEPAAAQATSASPQPVLPGPAANGGSSNPAASPVVDSIAGSTPAPVLEVRRPPAVVAHRPARRHLARLHRRGHGLPIDRPALAGVLLVEPIPESPPVPRPIVPMPAYFVDGIASAFTIPPPPVVCEHRRRDSALPDPHLAREVPVVCDNDLD